MFLIVYVLHTVIALGIISGCFTLPIAIGLFIAKSPRILPGIDDWWRQEQVRMLESETNRFQFPTEADDDEIEIIHPPSTYPPRREPLWK